MRPTPHRTAQVAVALLIVIVLRSLGEVLCIDAHGATGLTSEGRLYVIGAVAAAAAALVAFALHLFNRDGLAMAIAGVSILGLFLYKVVAQG